MAGMPALQIFGGIGQGLSQAANLISQSTLVNKQLAAQQALLDQRAKAAQNKLDQERDLSLMEQQMEFMSDKVVPGAMKKRAWNAFVPVWNKYNPKNQVQPLGDQPWPKQGDKFAKDAVAIWKDENKDLETKRQLLIGKFFEAKGAGETQMTASGLEKILGAPKEKEKEKGFTLGPGQQRFGPAGTPIAKVPVTPKEQTGFTLSPGQTRFGPAGDVIAEIPDTKDSTAPKLVTLKEGDDFVNYEVSPDGTRRRISSAPRSVVQQVENVGLDSIEKITNLWNKDPRVRNFDNIDFRFRNIQSTLDKIGEGGDLSIDDRNILTNFALIFRDDAIREWEDRALTENLSLLNRAEAMARRLRTGGQLTPSLRRDFLRMATDIHRVSKERRDEARDFYAPIADKHAPGVDFDQLMGPARAGQVSSIKTAEDFLKKFQTGAQ
jgi:hypothetical protein